MGGKPPAAHAQKTCSRPAFAIVVQADGHLLLPLSLFALASEQNFTSVLVAEFLTSPGTRNLGPLGAVYSTYWFSIWRPPRCWRNTAELAHGQLHIGVVTATRPPKRMVRPKIQYKNRNKGSK